MAKALTPTVKGKTVELGFDSEVREALRVFKDSLRIKKEADKAKAEAEVILRAKLGDAEFATISGEVDFKITKVSKLQPDLSKLLAEYPAVYEAIMVDGSYDFIKTVN
jgi:hypothetical protein